MSFTERVPKEQRIKILDEAIAHYRQSIEEAQLQGVRLEIDLRGFTVLQNDPMVQSVQSQLQEIEKQISDLETLLDLAVEDLAGLASNREGKRAASRARGSKKSEAVEA